MTNLKILQSYAFCTTKIAQRASELAMGIQKEGLEIGHDF